MARSRLVNGRRSRFSIARTAEACSRAEFARACRTSRADIRPPRLRREDLATSRPPRRDVERFLADVFLPFVARALRPEELFFLPKAVPEKTRQIKMNATKTSRRDLGEWKCRVI